MNEKGTPEDGKEEMKTEFRSFARSLASLQKNKYRKDILCTALDVILSTSYMTMQQPHPASFFPSSLVPFSSSLLPILSRSNGSVTRCPGLISVMFPKMGLVPCFTRGMGLYPACWDPSTLGAGLAFKPPPAAVGGLRGLGCPRGHSDGACSCRAFSSASRDDGWRPLTVCSASGENSRGSWAVGFS